jgi:beta-phosphoglucomutase-like phosphatase (HAD superfamily)
MRVAAVIFDMDGLMVDTEPLYKSAWQQAASELGYELNDELYTQFVGRPTAECEKLLTGELGAGFPLERFRKRWPVLWRSEVDRTGIHSKPGLSDLLAYVDAQRLPAAVATSTEAELAAMTLRCAGLAARFSVVVSGDQVRGGKPEPDIYLEAARRLDVSPDTCVAFEDSEAGIRAVRRAGMIGVLVPEWQPSEAAVQAAFRVVPTLHDARDVLASLIADGERARLPPRP